MSSTSTPSSERVHIGFFGCTNVGKSSLMNSFATQNISLVSSVKGTTTDPVKKAMELLPMGSVMLVDTAGFDDDGVLGALRVERTIKELETIDVAILVRDALKGDTKTDLELERIVKDKKVPYIIAYNKADMLKERKNTADNSIYVSSVSGENITKLKETVARLIPEKSNKIEIINSFVEKGDTVIMVTPIDEAAPKGRIILPQQQVLRNILDIGACAVVVQVEQLEAALENLKSKPKVVITDSQVFNKVSNIVPKDVLLTSFSILMANYKGVLAQSFDAVMKINSLCDEDKILIAEGCTHHRQCNDIGSVKIPNWIKKHTGKNVTFDIVSGNDFPEDLSGYAMVVHCGGCMITEKSVLMRMERAKKQNVPFTNYGILIAYMNGILERSVEVFPTIKNH